MKWMQAVSAKAKALSTLQECKSIRKRIKELKASQRIRLAQTVVKDFQAIDADPQACSLSLGSDGEQIKQRLKSTNPEVRLCGMGNFLAATYADMRHKDDGISEATKRELIGISRTLKRTIELAEKHAERTGRRSRVA